MRPFTMMLLLVVVATPHQVLAKGYPSTYVSHVVPYHVAGGALFSIVGHGFGETSGTVTLGETPCEVVAWSNGMIRARAPMTHLVAPVTVVAGGKTLVGRVPVTVARGPEPALPTITALQGAGADGKVSPGDTLSLTGQGFGQSQAEVTFAADPSLRYPIETPYADVPKGTVLSWSDTEVTVTVPDTCVGESYVLISLEGFVLLSPHRVVCPEAVP